MERKERIRANKHNKALIITSILSVTPAVYGQTSPTAATYVPDKAPATLMHSQVKSVTPVSVAPRVSPIQQALSKEPVKTESSSSLVIPASAIRPTSGQALVNRPIAPSASAVSSNPSVTPVEPLPFQPLEPSSKAQSLLDAPVQLKQSPVVSSQSVTTEPVTSKVSVAVEAKGAPSALETVANPSQTKATASSSALPASPVRTSMQSSEAPGPVTQVTVSSTPPQSTVTTIETVPASVNTTNAPIITEPAQEIAQTQIDTPEPEIKEPLPVANSEEQSLLSQPLVPEPSVSEFSTDAVPDPNVMPAAPSVNYLTPDESLTEKPAEPIQVKSQPSIAPKGITTVDLDEGNWFLKRQALERTMNTIEELNAIFTKILDVRMSFLTTRNKVDRDFDTFAKNVGFEMGDVYQILTNLIEQLEEERKTEGQLDGSERELLATIEKKLEQLKELRTDVTAITDLDASIDDVLMQVEQEIDQSHTYQTQGWRNFQAIKKVLNDEKADELALKTEGLLNNIRDIYTYLNNQLMAYFSKRVQTLQQNMETVKSKLNEFRKDETNLKKALENFVDAEKKAKKAQAVQEQEELEAAKKRLEEIQKPKPSFISTVIMGLHSFWNSLWSTLKGWLGL